MARVTMSIYKALEAIKTYEKQLSKINVRELPCIAVYTKATKTPEEVTMIEKSLQSNFDTYMHLTENIRTLKRAINAANLSTTVTIPGWNDGKEGTLADAIADHRTLEQKSRFLNYIQASIEKVANIIEEGNTQKLSPDVVYSIISTMNVADAKKSTTKDNAEVMKELYDDYVDKHMMRVIDPKKLMDRQWLNKQIADLDQMRLNFHDRIVQKNTETILEIDLLD